MWRLRLPASNHHDAQDAVQDAFLAAWTSLALFRGDAEFPTWLHPIVTRRATTMASQRRFTARLDDVSYPAGGTDPAEAVEQAAAMRSLADAVRELPAAQRSAIILRLDGPSYAQIADLSSTTIPAIRSHMFRARRALAATRPVLWVS
jgi:RNA polymerase sigma-70 factor, ECF subfamily